MLATADTATATAGSDAPTLDEPPRIRVVVADDHPLFRQGIVRALRIAGGFEVVAEAADGATALELIRRHQPDVAVVDVRMPGMDGIDVVGALARSGADVPVVLLSAFDDEPLVAAGLEAGAAAYITKSADRDALCLEIARAAGQHRSPSAIHGTPDLCRPRLQRWCPRLTSREHEVLQLAQAGWDKPELALLCGVDEAAVRRWLASALAKLGADDLAQGLAVARSQGIIR
jgi:two-component system nitrate/nitrite response regulator NarL